MSFPVNSSSSNHQSQKIAQTYQPISPARYGELFHSASNNTNNDETKSRNNSTIVSPTASSDLRLRKYGLGSLANHNKKNKQSSSSSNIGELSDNQTIDPGLRNWISSHSVEIISSQQQQQQNSSHRSPSHSLSPPNQHAEDGSPKSKVSTAAPTPVATNINMPPPPTSSLFPQRGSPLVGMSSSKNQHQKQPSAPPRRYSSTTTTTTTTHATRFFPEGASATANIKQDRDENTFSCEEEQNNKSKNTDQSSRSILITSRPTSASPPTSKLRRQSTQVVAITTTQQQDEIIIRNDDDDEEDDVEDRRIETMFKSKYALEKSPRSRYNTNETKSDATFLSPSSLRRYTNNNYSVSSCRDSNGRPSSARVMANLRKDRVLHQIQNAVSDDDPFGTNPYNWKRHWELCNSLKYDEEKRKEEVAASRPRSAMLPDSYYTSDQVQLYNKKEQQAGTHERARDACNNRVTCDKIKKSLRPTSALAQRTIKHLAELN